MKGLSSRQETLLSWLLVGFLVLFVMTLLKMDSPLWLVCMIGMTTVFAADTAGTGRSKLIYMREHSELEKDKIYYCEARLHLKKSSR